MYALIEIHYVLDFFSWFFVYACLRRDATKLMPENSDATMATGSATCAVCPWEEDISTGENATVSVSICPWEEDEPPSTSKQAIAR